MGRSVSTPNGYVQCVYLYPELEYGEEAHWTDFLEDIRNVVQEKYPSFGHDDRWIGWEDRAVLDNPYAFVTVSEHAGIVAVCLVPKDRNPLSQSWCKKISARFKKHLHKRFPSSALTKLGTASNEESFFEKTRSA